MQATLFGEQAFTQLVSNSECNWINNPRPTPDPDIMAQLRFKHFEQYRYKVYLGCWCSDSEIMIPAFESIRIELGIPGENVVYYALDANKKSPQKTEIQDGIEFLPTIIVYDQTKELGRIVETAQPNLESALLRLF